MSNRISTALLLGTAGALAYGAYWLGTQYNPDDPMQGLGRFVETVKDGMAVREGELREALGMELGAPGVAVPVPAPASSPGGLGDGARHTERRPSPDPLTAAQARELLRDPTGPSPRRTFKGPADFEL